MASPVFIVQLFVEGFESIFQENAFNLSHGLETY